MKTPIAGIRRISKEDYFNKVNAMQDDETGQLSIAMNRMASEIAAKQAELIKQMDEYQKLFELVPCLISVQDRDLKLIRYNRMFAEKFNPEPNDYCYRAYKGRETKCDDCPVEMTFKSGKPQVSEQSGTNKDGTWNSWIVYTMPVTDSKGEIVAAMEMSLDITKRKQLEKDLEKTEKKYYDIFNNIPNAVFVLDAQTLEVLDCNASMGAVYGYPRNQMLGRSFLDLFLEEERESYELEIRTKSVISLGKQVRMDGKIINTAIRISPSEHAGRKVLLVTTSDISKRIETEEKLAHASKLATLGEMATGVAHELNQPLSVIKTASSFLIKKINKKEKIDNEILSTMLSKVDQNVDRATNIIRHMRLFARKSEISLIEVQVNEVLVKAFDIFNQQLKARGIEVVWELDPELPGILADPDLLEQVFINLLINARDAIEDGLKNQKTAEKRIFIRTRSYKGKVLVRMTDTGPGIPEDIVDKIFNPFFTTKEVGKGTGLGLSISYGIIKDCGGEIRTKRLPGRGACFILEFPIKEEPK